MSYHLNVLQNEVLAGIENALREEDRIDVGALASFNAGVESVVTQNRTATDAEMLALHNIADQVVPGAHEVQSLAPAEAEPETAGDAVVQSDEASEAEVTQPSAGEPAPAGVSEETLTEAQPDPLASEPLFGGEETHDEAVDADEDDGA